jgi:hypothetical protein
MKDRGVLMFHRYYLVILFLLTQSAIAGVPSSFTYEGKVMNSAGTAPLTSVISLTLSLYDPTGTCLLYQEQQANIDLSQTNGLFAVQVGSAIGSAKRTILDKGLSLPTIFANNGQILSTSTTNCTAGYTPTVNDGRLLRVTVTNGGSTVTISPDLSINAVPNSMVAETLQGQTPAQLTPPGTIINYSGVSCPSGFIVADGTLYLATTYPNLALAYKSGSAYIWGGTVIGGSFNVPNATGVFLRGAGTQTIGLKTYTATIGLSQNDSTATNGLHDQGHQHGQNPQIAGTSNSNNGVFSNPFYIAISNGGGANNGFLTTATGYSNLTGDAETRPGNIAVNYCVKY